MAEPVFAAPPLLNEELARERIDAILTYWHYATRLETEGSQPFLTVADMIRYLDIDGDVPVLGYAFRDEWARQKEAALPSFVAASRETKMLLSGSEKAWARLTPQPGTDDPAVLASLRRSFRAGILEH
ncbi:hypothetical protein [Microvirga sp. 17 mud 1-3]|uniref:hypothetical protein n=1 Tax=Microvirga sp. 17 mud 1-3 TaxID=2082949 RepID=UPI000D6CDB90|nr:hypothetical protein [Microvirga sp. 17 mud 1-3]AWM85461.1 hypothetical protein C4E04_00975 [Microvirga sp. 17 mud 1-3]